MRAITEARKEWEAWRALAKIVEEKDATSHTYECGCDAWACRIYNAIRAWGEREVELVVAERRQGRT